MNFVQTSMSPQQSPIALLLLGSALNLQSHWELMGELLLLAA